MTFSLIVVGVFGLLAVVQALLSRRDRRRFPPPGSIIDGRHILKLGQGFPAVIFESGIANSSLSWNQVQPQIAIHAATYSYDRAGLGWSARRKDRCTIDQIALDLHALLGRLDVPRPMVLVGHSFGGYIARYYAYRFPAEIAGLVLVDPATPEEWMNPTWQQRWRLSRAVFFTRAAGVLACFGVVRLGLWLLLLRKDNRPGPISRYSQTLQRIRFELGKICPEVLPFIRAHWSRPGFYWAMADHLRAVPACAREVSNCPISSKPPVTVLSGSHQLPERLAEHAAMATRHIIAAGSEHFIHLDEPELVVDAVCEMLQQLKAASSRNFSPRRH